MPHPPSSHNVVAMSAVASYAVLHELPILGLFTPDHGNSNFDFGSPSAITVDLGYFNDPDDDPLEAWLACLPDGDADRVDADFREERDSGLGFVVPPLVRLTLDTLLPDLGVRIRLVVVQWRP